MQTSDLSLTRIAQGMFYLALGLNLAEARQNPTISEEEYGWVTRSDTQHLPEHPPIASSYSKVTLNGNVTFSLDSVERFRNWVFEYPEVLAVYWDTLGDKLKTSTDPTVVRLMVLYYPVVEFLDKELVLPYE